ncbi:hypothetical protein DMH02_028970 [Streptomyces sp. WAC 00631]|nr:MULTISPECIES: hypothetical protein [unclassified Streptomyces]MCC5037098.1 hypothetical protein [Streptomyces sp. WAC 00631]MCC9737702.1 hypothetical protein [Streptomyces sp. MNU89]
MSETMSIRLSATGVGNVGMDVSAGFAQHADASTGGVASCCVVLIARDAG